MTLCARLVLCCLLFAGCRAAVPPDAAPTAPAPASESTAGPRPDVPAPAGEPGGRCERMAESAALHFFSFTEQVASAAGVVVQAALVGLYFLLFPVLGFGHGGPG